MQREGDPNLSRTFKTKYSAGRRKSFGFGWKVAENGSSMLPGAVTR